MSRRPEKTTGLLAGLHASMRRRFGRRRRDLEHSGLFDPQHYHRVNPDVATAGMDACEHFLSFGSREGRSPHPLFDPAYYRQQVPETIADPLFHYLEAGAGRGCDPHPLFDSRYYISRCPDPDAVHNPLIHYLSLGHRKDLSPHPLFDSRFYRRRMTDPGIDLPPLVHFLQTGARQGLSPHPDFDCPYYLRTCPGVGKNGINPLVHYLGAGARMGCDPHPLFEGEFYRQRYPDAAGSGLNPLIHYVLVGAREGRNTLPLSPGPAVAAGFSVLIGAGKADLNRLESTLESIAAQVHQEWELCLVAERFRQREIEDLLARHLPAVSRPRTRFVDGLPDAARTLTDAVDLAGQPFVLCLRAGDTATPDCLGHMAGLLNTHPETDLIYGHDGVRFPTDPEPRTFRKPEWSPEWLRAGGYPGPLLGIRRSLLDAAGGMDPNFGDQMLYELCLRISEHTPKACLLDSVLCYPASDETNDGAHRIEAVKMHLERVSLASKVTPLPLGDGAAGIRPRIGRQPSTLSIVVAGAAAAAGDRDWIDRLIGDIRHPWCEIVAENIDPAVVGLHRLVSACTGDRILMIQTPLRAADPGWLEPLCGLLEDPVVGVVGPSILDTFGRRLPGEHGFDFDWIPGRLTAGRPAGRDLPNEPGTRAVLLLQPDCLLFSKRVFDRVGGFAGRCGRSCWGEEFCLRLAAAGYRNVHGAESRLRRLGPPEGAGSGDRLALMLLRDRWQAQGRTGTFWLPEALLPSGSEDRTEWKHGAC